jgi:hypothetical protein
MSTTDDAWNEVRKAARLLERMKVPYVLGGSLASSVQGAPRTTNDADIMVAAFPGREAEFAAEYGPGYYVSLPAIVDANRRRASFNIINTLIGFKVDFFVQKGREFDASAMNRRQFRFLPEGATESTAVLTVEDAILTKLEWYRLGGEASDRQWRDVIEMLEAQRTKVDRVYLTKWANELRVSDLLSAAFAQASAANPGEG